MLITRHLVADMPGKRFDFAEKGKMLIGAVMYPVQTYRWRQFLKAQPNLSALAESVPHLNSRIHRPYLSMQLKCAERVDMLMAHYELIFNARFGDLVKKTAIHPMTVGEFHGKSGAVYQLQLSAIDSHRRDGELALRLVTKGVCIYTASFILVKPDDVPCIKIGGLHGFLATDDNLRIKRITRDLHGCQPKDLMVAVVREIGDCFECRKMLLISNNRKIPAGRRACKKSSDYDRIWTEMHAVRRADGDFELPCASALATASGLVADAVGTLPRRSVLLHAILAMTRNRVLGERSPAKYAPAPDTRQAAAKKLKGDAG